jgi:hypothetical protein
VLLKKKEHELAMSETALFQFQIYIRWKNLFALNSLQV